MAPSELIERLSAVGCRLRADGEQLRVRAPEHALTDDLRQTIREHKAELLQLLRAETANMQDPVPIEWIAERDLSPESVAEAFQRYTAEAPGEGRQNLPEGALLSRFNLWLEAKGQRPTTLPVLRQAIREHKSALSALLQGDVAGDRPEPDLLEAFEERAAIMEYDGSLPGQEAERLAWKDVLHQQNGSVVPSYIKQCACCCGQDWGPSGRHTAGGCEVWGCRVCQPEGHDEWDEGGTGRLRC